MKRVSIAVLLGIAALSLTPASYAQQQSFTSTKNPGYLVDRNGNIVKSARTGQCVQLARQFNASMADRQCQATLAAGSAR